jgi:NAD(P)-dependent dehydrogenase (short-subunit alcohol dehydrogenase family)
MEMNLKGQRILLTGASRGIGKAAAIALASAGAQVIVHYSTSEETAKALAREIGNGAMAIQANLESTAAVEALFKKSLEHMGGLDILVNNAGIALSVPDDASNEQWLQAWHRTFAINTTAVGLLCKMAVEHFTASGGGRIITISSRAAFRGDTADYLAYAASKGALPALMRSIARAYGKKNIKAFTIAPGFVRTDMAQDFMDQYGEDYALNDIALPELTTPKDLAPTIVFLASGLADHATGCTIDINAASYVH